MKKMPTLFKRDFGVNHELSIRNEVTEGCEWVLNGEGVATQKLDGTCVLIQDGKFYKRYDARKGKPVPNGAIKCQEEADPITGHLPCWVAVDETLSANKWFIKAYKEALDSNETLEDGTYELCGVHFQNNPENVIEDKLLKHGSVVLQDVKRDFEGIKNFLETHNLEGIVFHRGNGEMCKIKRSDFGFIWNGSDRKRK